MRPGGPPLNGEFFDNLAVVHRAMLIPIFRVDEPLRGSPESPMTYNMRWRRVQ